MKIIAPLAIAASLALQCPAAASGTYGPSIVELAQGSNDHTTLVAAVKAAGLVDTLNSPGPFTVFAPTDAAFAALPEGTVSTLLKPENKEALQTVLLYHVVPGKVTAAQLSTAIEEGNGSAVLKTVQGQDITATFSGKNIVLTDARGGNATVIAADLKAKNGVVHATNAVSMPE